MSQVADRIRGWDALVWVLGHNQRDVFEKRYDLSAEVVAWFKGLDMFQEMERERMVLQTPTAADQAAHKALLSLLIGDGERLRESLGRENGFDEDESGITMSDFVATLDHLYDEQAVWHGEMTKERKSEILSKIFNGKGA
jgi:hypothetical protein